MVCCRSLSTAMDQDGLMETAPLTKALSHTADTYDQIALLCEDQPRLDFEPMGDLLHDYRGLLASFPDIITVHKVMPITFPVHDFKLTFKMLTGGTSKTARAGTLGIWRQNWTKCCGSCATADGCGFIHITGRDVLFPPTARQWLQCSRQNLPSGANHLLPKGFLFFGVSRSVSIIIGFFSFRL